MKFFTLVLLGAAALSDVSAASVVRPHLIVKGDEVENEFSAIVAIYDSANPTNVADRVFQGAQVFHRNNSTGMKTTFIITAADAFHGVKEDWTVKVSGSNGDQPQSTINDLKYKVYPGYDPNTKANNIAIFIPAVSWYHKDLLELPNHTETFNGTKMEILSYTKGSDESDFSNYKLYSTETSMVRSTWCDFYYMLSPLKSTHICVSSPWVGKAIRQKDIGAPLVYHGKDDEMKLAGVATVARTFTWFLPTEMTSIQPYLKWIDEEIDTFWKK